LTKPPTSFKHENKSQWGEGWKKKKVAKKGKKNPKVKEISSPSVQKEKKKVKGETWQGGLGRT